TGNVAHTGAVRSRRDGTRGWSADDRGANPAARAALSDSSEPGGSARSGRLEQTVANPAAQAVLSDSSSSFGVSLADTLYQTCSSLPFSSIRNAERSMPMYLRPYIDFSVHTA